MIYVVAGSSAFVKVPSTWSAVHASSVMCTVRSITLLWNEFMTSFPLVYMSVVKPFGRQAREVLLPLVLMIPTWLCLTMAHNASRCCAVWDVLAWAGHEGWSAAVRACADYRGKVCLSCTHVYVFLIFMCPTCTSCYVHASSFLNHVLI